MTAPILVVSNVGKAYRKYSSELARMLSWFNISAKPVQETWVLNNISFSLTAGEAVGIVGQNGAGKSTLLKLITGTQRPTTGEVHINGRIGAILELGMGFNPEFTGRQNAYHSAGLMGFSQTDIDSVIDNIENFAEIGDYFDKPVNTYSSGMQMRVAFSVITAFRPEILIVDEALSVGDTYFQHKSFSRIRDFQKQGTTLLLVSHDHNAIQALCNRAVLLENGKLTQDGVPSQVLDYYNAIIADQENSSLELKQVENQKELQTVSGNRKAEVHEIHILKENGKRSKSFRVGETVLLKVTVKVKEEIPRLVLGYIIKDRLGQVIFGTNTWHTKQTVDDLKAGDFVEYLIEFPINLGVGSYSISTALVSSDTHLVDNYEWRDLAYVFTVENLDKATFIGNAWIHPNIQILRK